jgi:hypothetical protein
MLTASESGTPVGTAQQSNLTAEPVRMQWNSELPVFARPEFLRAAGDVCGWIGGIDADGNRRCILPYTVIRKAGLRLVRFRTETIPLGTELEIAAEKSFLNSAVAHFKRTGADIIIPPSNNAVFRTWPDDASAAPYGTHRIDLRQPEEILWRNVSKTSRQNITTAQKDGIQIRQAPECLDAVWHMIYQTFRRSRMSFMSRDAFRRLAASLGQQCKVLVAEHAGISQSCGFFAFAQPSSYWIYGGNIDSQHPGAMKLLQWEAIRLFRGLGVNNYDFYGARIDPPKGSKQAGINQMKKHLGAVLVKGYVWKYTLRPSRAWVYSQCVRLLRGGDLVDQEQCKLHQYTTD